MLDNSAQHTQADPLLIPPTKHSQGQIHYFDTVVHAHTAVRLGSGSISQHKQVDVRSKLFMTLVAECNHFLHDPIYYKRDPSQSTPHNYHHPFSLLYLTLECRFIASCLNETVSEKNMALVLIFTCVASCVWSRKRKERQIIALWLWYCHDLTLIE